MYAIFGTCKEVTVGPTAVNALMTYNYVGSLNTNIIDAALTLGFFSGLIEIGTGILNLGTFIQSSNFFIHLKIKIEDLL